MPLPTHRPALVAALALSAAAALPAVPLAAQEGSMTTEGFDPSRAYMPDEPDFVPFVVEDEHLMPLGDALRGDRVDGETALLVTETAGGPIALVLDQMAYHHIAQGVEMGEPWMVSF